jgi:hypothetical protein
MKRRGNIQKKLQVKLFKNEKLLNKINMKKENLNKKYKKKLYYVIIKILNSN